MEHHSQDRPRHAAGYQNGVLTVIAAFLGLIALERFAGLAGAPSEASAQVTGAAQREPGESGGLVSAADQRKQIIAELKKMNQRLDQIDGKLKSPMSVKVTDMPPLKLPSEKAAGQPAPAGAAAPAR